MAANAYNHHLLKNKTKPAILMMNKRKAARDNCQNGKSSFQWSAAYPLDIRCPDVFRVLVPDSALWMDDDSNCNLLQIKVTILLNT